ncbi:MAG: DNA mismatch repair endonuclease MutL [Candidatus Heimdallarchaeum endolithica]|uniref:DNA mismatch repair protein MutL n=1 Tax=Candidatus Heimdallarchaeum endolithica TaxID=2876572 RepID=A0A9Y1BPX5_9ARCH|nr:MAG: DNA mismatch repair endonuclease MutL [Candidatus Heimdallarchaeum endolithica]
MNKHVIELDVDTINKIAAGEVIERPASVVKELVENAIDAKASSIEINIVDGGKKIIEVIDNGEGMSHDDVLTAIKRHTTSKLRTAEDLFNIHSMGFRGEALASIVSVSMTEIITRTADSELGTRLEIHGGKVVSDQTTSASVGTKVVVKNLFYNVPVRRKFLKNTSTELRHVTEIITKLALSKPDIYFKYTHNNKVVLSAPQGDLITNIATIFGKNMAKGALKIEKSENGYYLHGYILKPEFARKSKDYLYLFVNNRPIKDKLITDAILAGYGTSVPHGRYPVVFLYFNLPANEVDVNIHPTKREVKFAEEVKVYSMFESAIKEAFEASGLEIFKRVEQPKAQPTLLSSVDSNKIGKKTISTSHIKSKTVIKKAPAPSKSSIGRKREKQLTSFIDVKASSESISSSSATQVRKDAFQILGIIKDTYIIAEMEEGLVLCDQHAAAEKINYLKYLNQLKQNKVGKQGLLDPIVITLKPSEFNTMQEIINKLDVLGFEIKPFGQFDIAVSAVPTILGKNISSKVVIDVIDILKENSQEIKEQIEIEKLQVIKDLVALTACRRSIKAGDSLSFIEAKKLITELLEQDDPWTCPHGRPTMILLTEDYIKELFGRDYK